MAQLNQIIKFIFLYIYTINRYIRINILPQAELILSQDYPGK
jgi:hypothetical protein